MLRDEFILLDPEQRVQVLWNEAELIADRRYYECHITLFLLNNFFVEVFHDVGSGIITAVTIQDNVEILQAYATEVDLKEIESLLKINRE